MQPALDRGNGRNGGGDDQPPSSGESSAEMLNIFQVMWERRRPILAATLGAALIALGVVNVMTPKYKAEALVLIENRETSFTRPGSNNAQTSERTDVMLDQEAVRSNVQLILSRDLARQAVAQLKLGELAEFDSAREGIGPVARLLIALGMMKSPLDRSAEERILEAYYDRLTVFSLDRSRVIAIEFKSKDPALATSAANTIADLFLNSQRGSKQENSRQASQWLFTEIEQLRAKVSEAESRVEKFRSQTGLFAGSNNVNVATQQLAELNQQVVNARSARADAEARAVTLRELVRSGRHVEGTEVPNSEILRRLSEQRITMRATLALESQTLLPQHPRIKELSAQLRDLELQIRMEVERAVSSYETEAKVQEARVQSLLGTFEAQKKQVASTNEAEVQLRALEREAKAQREQLETFLARHRDAVAREANDLLPPDARVISRAVQSNVPASPLKLPIVAIAALGTFMLTTLIALSRAGSGVPSQPGPKTLATKTVVERKSEEPQPKRQPAEQPSEPAKVPERPAAEKQQAQTAKLKPEVEKKDLETPQDVKSAVAMKVELQKKVAPKEKAVQKNRAAVVITREHVNQLKRKQQESQGRVEGASTSAPQQQAAALKAQPLSPAKQTVEDKPELSGAWMDRASRIIGQRKVIVEKVKNESGIEPPKSKKQELPRALKMMVFQMEADQQEVASVKLARQISADTRCLLMEMRHGHPVAKAMGFIGAIGIQHVVSGQAMAKSVIRRDRQSRLDTMPMGEADQMRDIMPSALVALLDDVCELYPVVVIDAPTKEYETLTNTLTAHDIAVVVAEKANDEGVIALKKELTEKGVKQIMQVSNATIAQAWGSQGAVA